MTEKRDRRQFIASTISGAVAVALPPIVRRSEPPKFEPKVTNIRRPRRMGAQVTIKSADGESILSYWSPMRPCQPLAQYCIHYPEPFGWELELPPTIVAGDLVSILWYVAERFPDED